ncbi:MAG TPA: hypothetical protein ENN69_03880 [Spirochaetia bacterium]|nr:hypothetical protein [Spirochaetia bacterium]
MELTFGGVGFTEFFAAIVFVVFALFSFLALLSHSKFNLDKLARAFRLGMRLKANVIAALSFLAGLVFLILMVLLGGALGRAVGSAIPAVIFTVIGVIGLVYVLFGSAYVLNFLAIADIRDGKQVGFREALKAFGAQQLQVMLLPIIIGGIVLIEMGIMALCGEVDHGEVSFFLMAVFYLPFLPLNLVLFTLLFLGCGIFLPIMIDQKKGALATFKGIALSVKQQFLKLLSTQVVVVTFLGIAMVLMYLVFDAASSIGAQHETSPPMMIVRELLKNPGSFLEVFSGGSLLVVLGAILLTLLVLAVLAVAVGFIWNLNMCLYAAFYLGYIKESVDYKAALFEKKK